MTYNSNSKVPKGLHIGEALQIFFKFILGPVDIHRDAMMVAARCQLAA